MNKNYEENLHINIIFKNIEKYYKIIQFCLILANKFLLRGLLGDGADNIF